MNITPLLALALLIVCGVVYRKHFYNPKTRQQPQQPSTGYMVRKEYAYLLEMIESATTKVELAYWEHQAGDFEEKYRGHTWTHEMFIQLLEKIQEQFNLLSAQSLLQRAK